MNSQSIQSQDINIAHVFQSFYSVPDYQREYVWQSEQVEQLLNDIYSEMSGGPAEDAPEYFIGSIVVCPGSDGVFDLIDGQQRMTTLFLTLCAIRDRFAALGKSPPGPLQSQIATTSVDLEGMDIFRYRLALQYEDSGDILIRIAERTAEPIPKSKATRSVGNIQNAHGVILSFLIQQFGDDDRALRVFYGYFTNKVKLIRIHTENVARALKIFETINDRGVGLDSMDLLKNLLFMKAKSAEFESLRKIWKELQDTIHHAKEKPLRFLRYFIFSQYEAEKLREDEIYGWFSDNRSLCGYEKDAVKFAKLLLDAAKAYGHFLSGRDASGHEQPELQSLQYLGGSAARQHLILLLAGRHLPESLFRRLVKEVESLFFMYVATRENFRDFERSFARWAPEVRTLKTETEIEAFLARHLQPTKAELSERFAEAFHRLDSTSLQAYRLRYVLAKLNQHIEIAAYGETEGTRWLRTYLDSEYEIEHIHPQNPCEEAQAEFGAVSDPKIAFRLGNLTLVEKAINASLGNKPYTKKRTVYSKSKLLLVQSIAERPTIGSNTRIDRAVADLQSYTSWSESSVLLRQTALAVLARNVWDVPTAPARSTMRQP